MCATSYVVTASAGPGLVQRTSEEPDEPRPSGADADFDDALFDDAPIDDWGNDAF